MYFILTYIQQILLLLVESVVITCCSFYIPKNKINRLELTMIGTNIFIVELILFLIQQNIILNGFRIGSGLIIAYKLLK